ncbi:nucleotidyltransferase family protein [soil metagenome]
MRGGFRLKISAVVPAAGQSRRMGRPKLILPVEGRAVIARVVSALRGGGIDPVVVVAPPRGDPGAVAVFQQAMDAGAVAVYCPRATAEMRETVEHGLEVLERLAPDFEGLMIAPGDSVGLTPNVVSQIRRRFQLEGRSIVVAAHGGKRGHPLAIPRDLAQSIRQLPKDQGINALLATDPGRVVVQEVAEPGVLLDLDTPEDYRHWADSETGSNDPTKTDSGAGDFPIPSD